MNLKLIYFLLINLLLFILCLLGGSIGGIIGMYTFRHKTKHLKFKIGFPFIFLVQFILVLYTTK